MIDKLIWIKNLVFNSQQILGLWKNPLHFWKTEICKNRQISIIFWKKKVIFSTKSKFLKISLTKQFLETAVTDVHFMIISLLASNQNNLDHIALAPCYTAQKVSFIRSYSGPYFPAFGLNTERYKVSLRIQSECKKIRTRITQKSLPKNVFL